MLAGQFRDPVIGRDLLLGILFGILLSVFEHMQTFAELAFHRPPSEPQTFSIATLDCLRCAFATLVVQATSSLSTALGIFFLFCLVRLVCRKSWIAAIVTVLLFSTAAFGGENPLVDFLFVAPVFAVFLWVLLRFGLLALAATVMANNLSGNMPITTSFGAWYAEAGVFFIVAMALIVLYAFQISRAGKPLFGASFLDS
jgi:serine/threonine-protein kinase